MTDGNNRPTKPIIRVTIDEHGIWWKNTVQQDKEIGRVVEHLRAIAIGTHDDRPRQLASELSRYRGLDYRQLPRTERGLDDEAGSVADPDMAEEQPSG